MQVNLPIVNQLTDPDIDRNDDCVAACLASCASALVGHTVTLDSIKDAVYGVNYTGFQSASDYVTLFSHMGLRIEAVTGNLQAVVTSSLSKGEPVLLTIPSDWGDTPPTSQFSHVVAACDGTNLDLTCMNPWTGFYQTQPWGWWIGRQRGDLYIVGRENMGIPANWTDDGTTLTAPGGRTVTQGFRQHILGAPVWPGALVPLEEAHGSDALGDTAQQFGLALIWTKGTGAIAEVPGSPSVTQAPVPPAAPDPDTAQIAQLQAQLAAATAQVASLQAQLAAAGQSGSVEAIALVEAVRKALASRA